MLVDARRTSPRTVSSKLEQPYLSIPFFPPATVSRKAPPVHHGRFGIRKERLPPPVCSLPANCLRGRQQDVPVFKFRQSSPPSLLLLLRPPRSPPRPRPRSQRSFRRAVASSSPERQERSKSLVIRVVPERLATRSPSPRGPRGRSSGTCAMLRGRPGTCRGGGIFNNHDIGEGVPVLLAVEG